MESCFLQVLEKHCFELLLRSHIEFLLVHTKGVNIGSDMQPATNFIQLLRSQRIPNTHDCCNLQIVPSSATSTATMKKSQVDTRCIRWSSHRQFGTWQGLTWQPEKSSNQKQAFRWEIHLQMGKLENKMTICLLKSDNYGEIIYN